jgi:hypothetical protein
MKILLLLLSSFIILGSCGVTKDSGKHRSETDNAKNVSTETVQTEKE